MTVEHVPGKKAGHFMLYALSTCGWCRKTRQLLDEMGVEYYYEYVDHMESGKREEAMNTVRRWNPRCTFPTLVVNNERCIIGYNEGEIREALKP
ncbi:MAG: glutaredoxin family protein [Chloroflexi bacterium]|nr:glutaredoxin family protein [Chloroflexota bacterium]